MKYYRKPFRLCWGELQFARFARIWEGCGWGELQFARIWGGWGWGGWGGWGELQFARTSGWGGCWGELQFALTSGWGGWGWGGWGELQFALTSGWGGWGWGGWGELQFARISGGWGWGELQFARTTRIINFLIYFLNRSYFIASNYRSDGLRRRSEFSDFFRKGRNRFARILGGCWGELQFARTTRIINFLLYFLNRSYFIASNYRSDGLRRRSEFSDFFRKGRNRFAPIFLFYLYNAMNMIRQNEKNTIYIVIYIFRIKNPIAFLGIKNGK